MPSITTWTRVEPKGRSPTLPGLAARVHDPLWLLARQWQLGEWNGEDAASPVSATLETEEARLARYIPAAVKPGLNTTSIPYPAGAPLEAIVEAETIAASGTSMTVWLSALAGLDFLALMAADLAQAWSTRFPLAEPSSAEASSLPADQLAIWRLLSHGNLADGRAIYRALAPSAAVESAMPQAPEPALLEAWRTAYQPYFEPVTSGTWSGERLKYAFGVSASISGRELVLGADDYDGSGLDWWSFDIEPATTTLLPSPPATVRTQARIPVPVTFPGMPVSRFWEFEDSRVNLVSVDAERTDLARLLFLEFTLAFGNDFFLIPHAMQIGSICRTASLHVSDTFGERISIPPTDDPSWRMFQLSDRAGAAQSLLFLPPVLPRQLEGPAFEEVRFARDEMANIVWALEKLVASPLARPVRRAEQYAETHPRDDAPPTVAADGSLRYRLGTAVPDYWLPFVPNGALYFKRDGLVLPRGAIVGGSAMVREEEIPREGVEVSRGFQLARWIGGSTFLWVGRKRSVGTGEASSALKFDQADP